MWIETDYMIGSDDFCAGMDVGEVNEKAISTFNSNNKERAFAQLQKRKPRLVSAALALEYILIFKRYPEEDSTEDLAPFDSSEEADYFLNDFKNTAILYQATP